MTWWEHAACIGMDTNLFHPPTGFGPKPEHIKAKKVCWEQCPVRLECLKYAIDEGMRCGIWGGLNIDERKKWNRRTNYNYHPKRGTQQPIQLLTREEWDALESGRVTMGFLDG